MTIQDRGVRIEDRGTEVPESSMDNEELHWVSNTQSTILDPVSLERVRWRCRRGLLELDIVLGRFIPHYPALSEQQKLEFDVLLDMPDTQLWDMISGKQPAQHDGQSALLAMINSA